MRVDSPAKVTLQLRILRRRGDGYHDVRIALAPVALYDTLHVEAGGAPGIRLTVDSAQSLGPPEGNLVQRAALAFQEALGELLALDLRLIKRIPAGAGLGGGSGNAAAMLVALDRLHGHAVGPARLLALAAALGADVPFFLAPRPSWAEGRGERLQPLGPLPTLALLVVKPRHSIATGEAYAVARAEAEGGPVPDAEPAWRTPQDVAAGLFNAFEPALRSDYPELDAIKARLRQAGALGAGLSGSGSAVFGVFADAPARDAALAALRAEARAQGWALWPTHTLREHRYDFIFEGTGAANPRR